MVELQKIDPELLQEKKNYVVGRLEDKFDFYNKISHVDKTITARMTEEEVKLSESLEGMLSTFLAMDESARKYFPASNAEEEVRIEEFSKIFSLYAGVVQGTEKLKEAAKGMQRPSTIGAVPINFRQSNNDLVDDLAERYLGAVEKSNTSTTEGLVLLTDQFYTGLLRETLKKKEAFPELEARVNKLNIQINGTTITGFAYNVEQQAKIQFGTTWNDIVGNSEAKKALKSIADRLLLYDSANQTNIYKKIATIPSTLFIFGRPGTGKTESLKAFCNQLYTKAEKLNKKVEIVEISNDIKSKYFGESTERLDKALKKCMDPKYIGVGIVEDIDGMFFSREELGDHPAEKELLQKFMNLLEGVSSQELGNYVIISTTNRPKALDEALLQRIAKKRYEVAGPETEQDYIDLFKLKLSKGLKYGYAEVSDKDWKGIGKLCKEYNLSGRPVRNVSETLIDNATLTEISDDIYSLPQAEQEKQILQNFKKITGKIVLDEIEKYYSDEKKFAEIAKQEKVNSYADQIEAQYHAQEIVKERLKEKR